MILLITAPQVTSKRRLQSVSEEVLDIEMTSHALRGLQQLLTVGRKDDYLRWRVEEERTSQMSGDDYQLELHVQPRPIQLLLTHAEGSSSSSWTGRNISLHIVTLAFPGEFWCEL